MSFGQTQFQGWTLLEVLERTTDPRVWSAWIQAKGAYEKGKRPVPAGPPVLTNPPPKTVEDHRRRALDAFHDMKTTLWKCLSEGRLVAMGCRNSRTEAPMVIYSADWEALVVKDWENSLVVDRGNKIRFYNVRAFPVLHAPDAQSRLSGRTLSAVFKSYVIDDQEVSALSKVLLRSKPDYAATFEQCRYPNSLSSQFVWPLDLTASELAFDFVQPQFFIVPGPPLPKPSEPVLNVAAAIVARWHALRALLIDGKLIARGTFTATGTVGLIDAVQWARQELRVDVRNGDLCEHDGYKLVALWTGLSLLSSEAPLRRDLYSETIVPANLGGLFHVKGRDRDGVLSSTTERQIVRPSKAIARVERDQASFQACVAWLADIMKASPTIRRRSRQALWQEATSRWPNLSERAFIDARGEAVRLSGATAWAAAGATPKSLRNNRRSD